MIQCQHTDGFVVEESSADISGLKLKTVMDHLLRIWMADPATNSEARRTTGFNFSPRPHMKQSGWRMEVLNIGYIYWQELYLYIYIYIIVWNYESLCFCYFSMSSLYIYRGRGTSMVQCSPQCWTSMFFYSSLEWTNQTLNLEWTFCGFFFFFFFHIFSGHCSGRWGQGWSQSSTSLTDANKSHTLDL